MAHSSITVFLIAMNLLPAITDQVKIMRQPVDVTVEEGDILATISCVFLNINEAYPEVVSFQRGAHVISDELTIRTDTLKGLGLTPDNYKIKRSIDAGTHAKSYSLSIESPTRNDSSRYRCVVCGRDTDLAKCNGDLIISSKEVALTVNYPPAESYPVCGAPSLVESNTSFVLVNEGSPTLFACSSEIASPPVELTWTQNGAKVKGQLEVTDTNGTRESRLTFTPTREDNGTVLTCAVSSAAFNETERNCSVLPLNVNPKVEDTAGSTGAGGALSKTNIIIIVVLVVITVALVVAITIAYATKRRRKGRESRGHNIEYQPAETTDNDKEDSQQVKMELRG